MNQEDVIRSINELGDLMRDFAGTKPELLNLAARMQIRLDQLKALITAGRPDLKASLR